MKETSLTSLLDLKDFPSVASLRDKKVLDIGCGRQKAPGAIGLDKESFPGVDIVADLEKRLPIGDGEYQVVIANQVLEHVIDLPHIMSEVHRILVPGGQFWIHVPYYRSSWAFVDPTHVRFFTLRSLDYFVAGNWISRDYSFGNQLFSGIRKFLDSGYDTPFLKRIARRQALRTQEKWENSPLSPFFTFEQLSFVLQR